MWLCVLFCRCFLRVFFWKVIFIVIKIIWRYCCFEDFSKIYFFRGWWLFLGIFRFKLILWMYKMKIWNGKWFGLFLCCCDGGGIYFDCFYIFFCNNLNWRNWKGYLYFEKYCNGKVKNKFRRNKKSLKWGEIVCSFCIRFFKSIIGLCL